MFYYNQINKKVLYILFILMTSSFLYAQEINQTNNSIESVLVDSTKVYGMNDDQQPAVKISAKVVDMSISDYTAPKLKKHRTSAKTVEHGDIIELGIQYIQSCQSDEGNWSGSENTSFIDTVSVARLYKSISWDQNDPSYTSAIEWLESVFPSNTEYTAEKILALSTNNQQITLMMSNIFAQIHLKPEKGFGYNTKYWGNPITTAKILESIHQTNYTDPGNDPVYSLKASLLYLINSQNNDGGWGETVDTNSTIIASCIVIDALSPYSTLFLSGLSGGDINIQTRINMGIQYLINNQNSNGTWDNNLLKTAMAIHTILNNEQYSEYHQEALNYLIGQQNIDGSFGDKSIYKMSKCLMALAKPDIRVISIKNVSELIPNEPTVIEVTIRNNGHLSSMPLNFAATPHSFILIVDGKEIIPDFSAYGSTVTFAPNSTMILQVILEHLPFGSHTIGFKVEYQGIELNKQDNSVEQTLVFDDPGFSGPEPPQWFGASSGEIPGSILIRWHTVSIDTNQFAIYASTQSGSYDSQSPIALAEKNIIGKSFTFTAPMNIRIYFTIAAIDENGFRGDYSKESWAIAYDDPNSMRGSISGKILDNNQRPVPEAEIDFYTYGSIYSSLSGYYNATFYPGFYFVTASKNSYNSFSKEVQIVGQENVPENNFTLDIINDGTIPGSISGLYVNAENQSITLRWDIFDDIHNDFDHFNIYRSIRPIENIDSMSPYASVVTNSADNHFSDQSVTNGIEYYFAVVVQDIAGNISQYISSIVPVTANAPPQITPTDIFQKQDQVFISFNLEDNENQKVFLSFEYYADNTWNTIQSIFGDGLQTTGEKTAIWNIKQEYPGYEGDVKVKIIADDQEEYNHISQIESQLFRIDTKNPERPEISNYITLTDEYFQTISGSKNIGTSLLVNDTEISSFDDYTMWNYQVILKKNTNLIDFQTKDQFGNISEKNAIEIVYNTPPTLVINEPDGLSDTVAPSKGYTINWFGIDEEDNDVTVSLYYTQSNIESAVLINTTQLSENENDYFWNTSLVPEGEYFICIVANDSVNEPVTVFSTGKITLLTQISVCILPETNWLIGSQPLNSIITSSTFEIINNGNVVQDIFIYGTNSAGGWKLLDTTDENTFTVEIFKNNASYSFLSNNEQEIISSLSENQSDFLMFKYHAPSSDSIGADVNQNFSIIFKASMHAH